MRCWLTPTAASAAALKGPPSAVCSVDDTSGLAATIAGKALVAALSQVAQLRAVFAEAEDGPTSYRVSLPPSCRVSVNGRVRMHRRARGGGRCAGLPCVPLSDASIGYRRLRRICRAQRARRDRDDCPAANSSDQAPAMPSLVHAAAYAGVPPSSADADKTKPSAKQRKAGQAAVSLPTPGLHIKNEMTLAQVLVQAARFGLASSASAKARSGSHSPRASDRHRRCDESSATPLVAPPQKDSPAVCDGLHRRLVGCSRPWRGV